MLVLTHEGNMSHSTSFWLMERPGWHPDRSAGLGPGLGLGLGLDIVINFN